MKLNLTVIKNETCIKFDKAIDKVKDKFMDMLSLSLDACVHEIDADKRKQVEIVLNDLFSDELNGYKANFIHTMFKAGDLIEESLSS